MDPNQSQNQSTQPSPIQPTQGVAAQGVLQTPTPTPAAPLTSSPPPQAPSQQTSSSNQSSITTPRSGGKKLLYILLIIFGVLIVVAIAFIVYLNFYPQSTDQSLTQTQSAPTSIPTAVPTPASEEEELNSLNIDDPESQLQQVNADLQQL